MEIIRYPMNTKKQTSRGMSPDMTQKMKTKKTARKKPKNYTAPLSVRNYYKGISFGMDLLRDDLCKRIDDEDLQEIIKERARQLKTASTKELKSLENKKTKERITKWEEKEWERL